MYTVLMKAFQEIREYQQGIEVWHSFISNIGISAHWHNELEFIHIACGSCIMNINSETITASEGDIIVCDSGDVHYCNEHSPELVFEFLIFNPDLLKFHIKKHAFGTHIIKKDLAERTGLTLEWNALCNRIDRELSGQMKYYIEYIRSELSSFWCFFLRVIDSLEIPDCNIKSQNQIVTNFRGVLSYMEEHFKEDITLDDIAQIAGFSVSYTSKYFRKLTGYGFLEYLNMLRISHAAEQLHNTDLRIIDVAYDCGFNNIRSFNRTFLKYTGWTPSDYRDKHNDEAIFFASSRSFAQITTGADKNPTVIS